MRYDVGMILKACFDALKLAVINSFKGQTTVLTHYSMQGEWRDGGTNKTLYQHMRELQCVFAVMS